MSVGRRSVRRENGKEKVTKKSLNALYFNVEFSESKLLRKRMTEENLCFKDYCFLKTPLIISECLIGRHYSNYLSKLLEKRIAFLVTCVICTLWVFYRSYWNEVIEYFSTGRKTTENKFY